MRTTRRIRTKPYRNVIEARQNLRESLRSQIRDAEKRRPLDRREVKELEKQAAENQERIDELMPELYKTLDPAWRGLFGDTLDGNDDLQKLVSEKKQSLLQWVKIFNIQQHANPLNQSEAGTLMRDNDILLLNPTRPSFIFPLARKLMPGRHEIPGRLAIKTRDANRRTAKTGDKFTDMKLVRADSSLKPVKRWIPDYNKTNEDVQHETKYQETEESHQKGKRRNSFSGA